MKYVYCLTFALLFLCNPTDAQTRRDKSISLIHQYMAQIEIYIEDMEKNLLPAGMNDSDPRVVKQRAESDSIYALRKKIILISQEIKPPLALPERAREYYVKGVTLLEDPATKEYNDVIGDLEAANSIAPWWTDDYKQLGKVYEIIRDYKSAIESFQLYLLSNPEAKEARDVQDEIYIIEAKMKAKE